MLKLRRIVLVLMMSFLCLFQVNGKPVAVHAIPAPDYFSATLTSYGSGTAIDPFRIYFLKQLGELANINLTDDHIYRYGHYLLMNDLDFSDANADGNKNDPYIAMFSGSGNNWVPIGTSDGIRSFVGVLDGNSFSIRNLTINNPASDFQGLFASINGTGEVRNLHLINASIQGRSTVGGIAGLMMNGAHLTNVSVQGTITGVDSVGGLVGQVSDGAGILNSGSNALLFGNQFCGGLVGYATLGFGRLSISNSYFSGSFNPTVPMNYVGGIIGFTVGAGKLLEVDLRNVIVKMNTPIASNIGYFIGVSGSSLLIDTAYNGDQLLPAISSALSPYTIVNTHLIGDLVALKDNLNAWVDVNNVVPGTYYPWRLSDLNSGYPVLNDTIAAYVGDISYTTLGTSVSVDPNFTVYAPLVKFITISIQDAQASDLLVSPMIVIGITALYAIGTLTLSSATPVSGLIFQDMLRVVEFSTSGNATTRVIHFTFFDGNEDVIAIKKITMPGFSVLYDSVDQDSGTMPIDLIKYWSGTTATILGNPGSLIKAGHTFAGWTDGTTDYQAGDTFTITKNKSMSALWSTNSYNVSFTDDDGTLLSKQKVTYGADAIPPLNNPFRAGYNFTGWDKDYTGITADSTFKASYDPITTSLTDKDTKLNPILADFADAVTFTASELDPVHVLSLRFGFGLRSIASLTPAEKAKLDAYLATLGTAKTIPSFLFDISLFKSINQQEIPVITSNRPIVITISVPEAFRGSAFKLLRLHTDGDGVTTLVSLPYTYNTVTFTATFSSDQFSVFGFAYGTTQIPNTGEGFNALGWSALGLSVLLGLISFKRRQKSK